MKYYFSHRRWFIVGTILIAFMLEILPLPGFIIWFRPAWTLLVLIYWAMALPEVVGVGYAFMVGIFLDVLTGTLLGEHAFAMVCEVTERALAHTEKKEVLLTGGVAANVRLQEIIRIAAKEQNAVFHVVPKAYSGDCGAQIAWTGLLAYQNEVQVDIERSFVKPRWRLDQVKIPWR